MGSGVGADVGLGLCLGKGVESALADSDIGFEHQSSRSLLCVILQRVSPNQSSPPRTATLAYTPGNSCLAHPTPNDTTPTCMPL